MLWKKTTKQRQLKDRFAVSYMYTLSNEQKIILEIANHIMEPEYTFYPPVNIHVHWHTVLQIALQQKCFPIVYNYIKQYLPVEERAFGEAIWIRHKIIMDKLLREADQASGALQENGIQPVIVKGFMFAHLIYDNPYMRQFGDIDIFVAAKDTISSCKLLESMGYEDYILSMTEKCIDVPPYARYLHYYDMDEKQYFKERSELIEIKDNLWNFPSYIALQHTSAYEISSYCFYGFIPEYAFLYFTQNIFINFSADWGVVTDYCIRDIIDYYCFIIRHVCMFTTEYIKKVEEFGLLYTVTRMLSIMHEFFSDETFTKLPPALLKLGTADTSPILNYPWASCLYERLFEPKKRIEEYYWIMHQACFENSPDYQRPPGAIKQECDYKNGFTAYHTQANMRNFFLACLTSPVYFGVDYDEQYVIFMLHIPSNYPDIIIDVDMRNGEAVLGEKYTFNFQFNFFQKEIAINHDEIGDVQLFHNLRNNIDIISIVMPKQQKFIKRLYNKNNYFISFKISLPSDIRQWSSCIASYNNIRVVET